MKDPKRLKISNSSQKANAYSVWLRRRPNTGFCRETQKETDCRPGIRSIGEQTARMGITDNVRNPSHFDSTN